MQHTVIAFFDTYPQAEAAREALVAAGIAYGDVTLKARCEPTYASDATSASASQYAPTANEGLLASIERFFESLFVSAPPERETAQYAEAVRRGAVMVCVDAPTDALATVTRTTLEGMGPLDIAERAATWQAPADEATRSHSPLEELGLRPSVPVQPTRQGSVHSYAHEPASGTTATAGATNAAATQPTPKVDTEAAATAVAAGSAPGMGAVFTSGRISQPPATEQENAASPTSSTGPTSTPPPAQTPPVPDEYLQDEEVYRGDEPRSGST
ncbi:MAG TPA: hypothetical protein VF446_03775 [Trinickia sp.]